MQVRVIRARADQAVGDVVEMPDGAQFSDLYYEPAGRAIESAGPDFETIPQPAKPEAPKAGM